MPAPRSIVLPVWLPTNVTVSALELPTIVSALATETVLPELPPSTKRSLPASISMLPADTDAPNVTVSLPDSATKVSTFSTVKVFARPELWRTK